MKLPWYISQVGGLKAEGNNAVMTVRIHWLWVWCQGWKYKFLKAMRYGMNKTDILYYVDAIKELREEAIKNVADKDMVYTDVITNINQCLTFSYQAIKMKMLKK